MYDTQTELAPSTAAAEAAKVFAQIRAMDLRRVEFDDLLLLLRSAFIGMRTQAPYCEAGLVVYRGVRFDGASKPSKRARVSYPPIDCAKDWNRVTRRWQSAFYCSVVRDTIPFELDLQPGAYVAIGRWRSTAQLMFMQVGFNQSALAALGGDRVAPDWANHSANSLGDLDVQIDGFLSEQFSKVVRRGDEHLFKVSVAIAESLLHNSFGFRSVPGYIGSPRIAGLVYPSVATLGSADNLALFPSVVDDSFCLDFIEWSCVEASGPDFCRLRPVDCANTFGPNGEIEWRGRPPQYSIPPGGTYTMRGGEIIDAFDEKGRRLHPS